MNSRLRNRLLMIVPGMFALLAAMWAGLLRMGWALPRLQPMLAAGHGPLMIAGFLGTLVSLERAAALGMWWTFAAPILTGLGGISLAVGLPDAVGAWMITLGSAVLLAIFVEIYRRQPILHSGVLTLAAVLYLVGNVLWVTGHAVPVFVLWWMGYLVMTVAGERLELSRLLFLSKPTRAAFLVATGIFLAGAVYSVVEYNIGWRVAGAGLVALAAWMLTNDIARRTVRQKGLTRYIALCLLTGYVWLGFAGLFALVAGIQGLYHYDAILHSVFLGFVISMVFGHAPVIFPSVLGKPMPFSSRFYGHLILLHLSLLLRVTGDLAGALPVRQWGGMLNVFAMLLFVGNTVTAIVSGLRAKNGPAGPARHV